ncbi:DUF2333 family protein [Lacimicrobium alkaliphilum]|uniref:DUF2333 domain-containing protein n=1 Tax=Lacimicrobium alkaliphilum TaxID=1526571 RepID=A0A0U2PHJ4_9ALTE|nr:DUF2333 family protein [Lacimicrobium alkaliphilum]ALS99005.1 hypothetical protein AT746_12520 [Lacimicrobium alkaliphilum]
MREYLNLRWISLAVGILLLLFYILAVYWSSEPEIFDVDQHARTRAEQNNQVLVPGYTTTSTLIRVASTLMDKPGGYLSNDVMPPSVLMDNMPAWEFGVLEMVRDLALAMRKDLSRSQSQSSENSYLVEAQPKFNIDSRSWILPSAESQYEDGIQALQRYLDNLANPAVNDSQFYTRADNLRDWLRQVEKRMGSLSQRLSASVGQSRLNTDLAGDAEARQSTPSERDKYTKTSWWELDDVFYEARGASWALLHLLKAVETDFADVLEKKNAAVSLKQIIRELEATQQSIWSPMILNGGGFGMMANHSLVMANYISRANAALIDLNDLLNQG